MGQTLQRHLGVVETLDLCQWTNRDSQTYVRCPRCGGIDKLSLDFTILSDGRVVPEWNCPTQTCGLSLWLYLHEWGP